MSIHDDLKRDYGEASPEQKLSVLRHELLRSINICKSVVTVLDLIEVDRLQGLPDPLTPDAFSFWRNKLTSSVEEFQEILY